MLAKNGVIRADELRRLSPFDLPDDETFAGSLVGGRNLLTSNPIESAVHAMVIDLLASVGADSILDQVDGHIPTNRLVGASVGGNGRH